MRKERADVRVEPELLEELDIIAQRKGQSRSEAIRDAIACFVDEEKDGWNTTRIDVKIPNRLADKVDWAITNCDADNVDAVVEKSLEHWLELRQNFYLGDKGKLDQIAAENAKKDTAKRQLEEAGRQLARR